MRKVERVTSLESLNRTGLPSLSRDDNDNDNSARSSSQEHLSNGCKRGEAAHSAASLCVFFLFPTVLKHLMPPPGGDTNYTNSIKL